MRRLILLVISFVFLASCGRKTFEGPESLGIIKGTVFIEGNSMAHEEKVRVEACVSDLWGDPMAKAEVIPGDGFSLEVPRGVYDIWALGPGDLKGRISRIEVIEGGTVDVGQLKVAETWPVRGRFLTGVEEMHGKVWVMGSSIEVEPDEDGRYEIMLPEGEYTIGFEAEGIGTKTINVVVKHGNGTVINQDLRMGRLLVVLTRDHYKLPCDIYCDISLLDIDSGEEKPLGRMHGSSGGVPSPKEPKLAIATDTPYYDPPGHCFVPTSSSGIWIYDVLTGGKYPVYPGEEPLMWEEVKKAPKAFTPPPELDLFRAINTQGYKLIFACPLSWSWDGKWIICFLCFYNAGEDKEIGGIAVVRGDTSGSGAYWAGSFQYELPPGSYGLYRGETVEEARRRKESGILPPFYPVIRACLSPDGKTLMVSGYIMEMGVYKYGLYIEEGGKKPKKILSESVHPIWTPDGRICFSELKHKDIFWWYEGLYIMNPDGRGKIALTDPGFKDIIPFYVTPDGKWVYIFRWIPAFSLPSGNRGDLEYVEIWAVKTDGSKEMKKKWSLSKKEGLNWDNKPYPAGIVYIKE